MLQNLWLLSLYHLTYSYCKSICARNNGHIIFKLFAASEPVNVKTFKVQPQVTNTYKEKYILDSEIDLTTILRVLTWIAFNNVVLKWSSVRQRIRIIWIPNVATVLGYCWSALFVNENATNAKPVRKMIWYGRYLTHMNFLYLGWSIRWVWIGLFNLPCSTSSCSLTRLVSAFSWAITSSISCYVAATSSRENKNSEIDRYIDFIFKKPRLFMINWLTYVLESVWELVHASFLNWTIENNENTEKEIL